MRLYIYSRDGKEIKRILDSDGNHPFRKDKRLIIYFSEQIHAAVTSGEIVVIVPDNGSIPWCKRKGE